MSVYTNARVDKQKRFLQNWSSKKRDNIAEIENLENLEKTMNGLKRIKNKMINN